MTGSTIPIVLVIAAVAVVAVGPYLRTELGLSEWYVAPLLLAYPLVWMLRKLKDVSVPCPPWIRVTCGECGTVLPDYDFNSEQILHPCPSCGTSVFPIFNAICPTCCGSIHTDADTAVPSTCPHCQTGIDTRLFSFDYLDKQDGPEQCAHCGYRLAGLTEPRCPECGTRFPAWLLCKHERSSASDDATPRA